LFGPWYSKNKKQIKGKICANLPQKMWGKLNPKTASHNLSRPTEDDNSRFDLLFRSIRLNAGGTAGTGKRPRKCDFSRGSATKLRNRRLKFQ